jgi:hypothetical protein
VSCCGSFRGEQGSCGDRRHAADRRTAGVVGPGRVMRTSLPPPACGAKPRSRPPFVGEARRPTFQPGGHGVALTHVCRRHGPRQLLRMRQAALLILLVGCIADLPTSNDQSIDAAAPDSGIAGVRPTHEPDECPTGGGGGGGADPNPIPSPKDCTVGTDHEACYQCCNWNVDKVWGEQCRRMPGRTKKQRQQKALCWERAEALRGECQAACPHSGPIITSIGAP